MLDAIRKGIYGYVDRGRALTCPVYIDDLVQAYVKAVAIFLEGDSKAISRISGRTYNITSGETITWKAYSEYAASFAGLSLPKAAIPAWLGYLAAGLLTAAFHLVRSRTAPPLTKYRIQQASHHYHFSMARAKEELGYNPKTMAPEGLEIACTDWRQKTH
jgi:nucleoside-diphosphate-sugar epimerase